MVNGVVVFALRDIYKLKEFHFAFFDCVLGIFFSSSFELKCGQQVETAAAAYPASTTVFDVAAAEQQQHQPTTDDHDSRQRETTSNINDKNNNLPTERTTTNSETFAHTQTRAANRNSTKINEQTNERRRNTQDKGIDNKSFKLSRLTQLHK